MIHTVDLRATGSYVGTIVKYLSAAMVVPLLVAVVYAEDVWVFGVSMALGIAIGLGLEQLDSSPELGPREALAVVSLAWLMAAIVGAIPYLLAGYGTESTLRFPINALFESMSGFTTTGSTVTGELSFDRHSHAVLCGDSSLSGSAAWGLSC